MTDAIVETGRTRQKVSSPRVLLSCDDSGSWTLSGQRSPARRFPDFKTAVECARRTIDSQSVTIEVWQSGEYICCVPREQWPHRGVSVHAAPIPVEGRILTIPAERYANRAARVFMIAAGTTFWLALMVVALAASFGWRLAFH